MRRKTKMRKLYGTILAAVLPMAAFPAMSSTDGMDFVDPLIGTEGIGSQYGGMMPYTGVPFGSFQKVNHYVLKRMTRFLNRKSQRYYRLKFADTYYGEMTHYGLYRLAWADVRRTRD